MSLAFEITPEDVADACKRVRGTAPDLDSPELAELVAVVMPHAARIEAAALYGDDMDDQTEYAIQEIAAILVEAGRSPATS